MQYEVHLQCAMCLRKFTVQREHGGRLPHHCPECARRRATVRSAERMATMRARRRAAQNVA